jgi:hypothetical protein
MMRRSTWSVLGGIAFCFLGLAGSVPAQTNGGTGILKIKPGARATGMGQAGVALDQRAHSVWWNPALLAEAGNKQVSSTMAKLVPDLANDVYYLNMGYAQHLEGWGGVAFDVMYLSYGKTEATDTDGNSHGFFSSYEFVPVLGFGTKLIEGEPEALLSDLEVGIALKYVLVDLAPEWALQIVGVDKDGRADAFGVDLGMAVRGKVSGLPYSIGMNVQNLGSELVFIDADQGDPLPHNLKLGIGLGLVQTDRLGVVVAVDVNKPLIRYPPGLAVEGQPGFGWGNMQELWNAGAELTAMERLHFRLGYVNDPEGEIQAMTFGAGLDVAFGDRTILFDYSSVPQALDLERVSYLSVGVQF